MVENTMDVAGWLRKQLEQASPDLLRAMVRDFAEALIGAEADALCGAAHGERSPERDGPITVALPASGSRRQRVPASGRAC